MLEMIQMFNGVSFLLLRIYYTDSPVALQYGVFISFGEKSIPKFSRIVSSDYKWGVLNGLFKKKKTTEVRVLRISSK